MLADDGPLTYRELAAAVVATAGVIRSTVGTRPGGQVALLCRHGAGTVVALLGSLSAGRAYVPLDPTFPAHRLAHILADSDARGAAHRRRTRRPGGPAAGPGRPTRPARRGRWRRRSRPADLAELVAGLATPAGPDDPAYLLYTSGSTGTPKGVVQSHRNVLFGVGNHVRNFALTAADRTSVLTSFGYDMAVTDTFSALLSGAAVVPVDIRNDGLGHLARTLAGARRHRLPLDADRLPLPVRQPRPRRRAAGHPGRAARRRGGDPARRRTGPPALRRGRRVRERLRHHRDQLRRAGPPAARRAAAARGRAGRTPAGRHRRPAARPVGPAHLPDR